MISALLMDPYIDLVQPYPWEEASEIPPGTLLKYRHRIWGVEGRQTPRPAEAREREQCAYDDSLRYSEWLHSVEECMAPPEPSWRFWEAPRAKTANRHGVLCFLTDWQIVSTREATIKLSELVAANESRYDSCETDKELNQFLWEHYGRERYCPVILVNDMLQESAGLKERFVFSNGFVWSSPVPLAECNWKQLIASSLGLPEDEISEGMVRSVPAEVKREVWRRDEGRCVKCGSPERLEYDHIIPFSFGGGNTARNIQLLCERCNRAKAATIE